MRFLFAAAAILGAVTANTNADDTTGIFGNDDQWKTGIINIGRRTEENSRNDMFYWVFQSRDKPKDDPLVMWLTGGPGCASEVALFFENGPYKFPDDITKTGPFSSNSYSWNTNANLLYVDQPIGTGYSHSSLRNHTMSEKAVAEDMGVFLQGFLAENPEYEGRDFFITGESYAGHYVPAISYYIKKYMPELKLNLKGIAIGNGLTDPF